MNKESFNHLLEIQSCERKIEEIQVKIQEENNRIIFLENNIHKNLQEIALKKETLLKSNDKISILEKNFNDFAERKKRIESNITNATNQIQLIASEKELESIKPQMETTESEIMQLWEEIESLEKHIENSKEFKIGSANSLEVLKKEIGATNDKHGLEIKKISLRQSELFNLIGEASSNIFKKLQASKPPAVSFMENKRCNSCKTLLDNSLITEINAMRDLCFCTTCGRILVSLEVRY